MSVLNPQSLASAKATAALFFDLEASIITYDRTSDGAGGWTRELSDDEPVTFPCALSPIQGSEAEEFYRATGKKLYGLYYPLTVDLSRTKTISIDGAIFEVVFETGDQTPDDAIQLYAKVAKT